MPLDGKIVARVFLHGSFCIESIQNSNLTPVSEKARAVIALLVTSPRGERSRQWLQSKLWSDRGPEQASASLRQALVQIRKALGSHKDIVNADRQRIGLDLQRIFVAPPSHQEFLEGMDVRDPEFEQWLTEERMRREAGNEQATAPGMKNLNRAPRIGWTIAVDFRDGDSEASRWFGGLFADAVAKHLRELFSANVIVGPPPETHKDLWTICIRTSTLDQANLGLRATLDHPASRRQIWAGHRQVTVAGAPPIEHPDVLRLSNELVEALGDTLVLEGRNLQNIDDPDRLCRNAVRRVFSMTPDAVAEADTMFANAFAGRERGLYLAWRAQIRAIQRIEKHSSDVESLAEEGEYLCARALELEPNNSMVLATVANTLGFLTQDRARSLDLAKRSVRLNPANPMGWWALSSASVYTGNIEDSYSSAVNARNLALLSPHRFWWDNQQFGAAVVTGRLDEAMRLAESAQAQNRNFRPPLRYLIALYANAGREEDAERAAEMLKALEPEFTIDQLANDPKYPASLIHRAPGLELERLSALI